MIFEGKVISIDDEYKAGNIKVRLKTADLAKNDKDLPLCAPLLPKMFHVMPKVGEVVQVVCVNDDPNQTRFYIGPFISQPQKMYKDAMDGGALKFLNKKGGFPYPSTDNIPKTYGAYGKNEDVAVYGRKYSDVILSDNDVRIRCGARIYDGDDTTVPVFNKKNPSVIKLKYHDNAISTNKPVWNSQNGVFDRDQNETEVHSSTNIIGQEINLISTDGNPWIDTSHTDRVQNGNETISDNDIKKFIETAHPLPYGDVLIKFMNTLTKAFMNHTHRYSQLPPVMDENCKALSRFNIESILSKNIRIN